MWVSRRPLTKPCSPPVLFMDMDMFCSYEKIIIIIIIIYEKKKSSLDSQLDHHEEVSAQT